MGYDHSLSFEATCLPGVSKNQVLQELQEIAEYMGWSPSALASGELKGDDQVFFAENEQGRLVFTMSTSGEVGHSFPDMVRGFCDRVSPFMEPAVLELRDHDTGDLQDAIERIWVGSGQALHNAQREYALIEAMDTLRAGGFTEHELNDVRQALGFPAKQLNQARPKA